MAVAVRLDDVLHARRMTLTELAEKVDVSIVNLSILKTGKARAIRFSTLEAICAALACQPGACCGSKPRRRSAGGWLTRASNGTMPATCPSGARHHEDLSRARR